MLAIEFIIVSFIVFRGKNLYNFSFCLPSQWGVNSQLFLVPETKTAEFTNSVDLDEVAHDEPPHLDLHCFPSSL